VERIAVLRYAEALFGLAVEKNSVAAYNQAAASILFVFEQDENIRAAMDNPAIPIVDKVAALKAAFLDRVPEDFVGLLALMLRRGRNKEIMPVLRHFDVLYKEYSRMAVARLYSPEELPTAKVAEITSILSKKLDKTIQIECIIDKSLIAGFRVEVDGFVFDGSAKHQMDRMKRQLLGKAF